MSLYIASLNSGSNGNCYYVGNEEEAVLVDAGISCREIEKRLARLSLPLGKIKAVFISHEHSDHIRGVEVLARKHRLPVYITAPTQFHGALKLENELTFTFGAHETIRIGQLHVTAFPKSHDASDPYSFTVSGGGTTVGVFTDIGYACQQLIHYFKQCHAVFLEANYDERMLEEGHYPFYLKKRISGDKGHLSNRQALELFTRHRSDQLSHIILSHLSKENNSPQLVQNLFSQHAGDVSVIVASREYESNVYHIRSDLKFPSRVQDIQVTYQAQVVQMSLF